MVQPPSSSQKSSEDESASQRSGEPQLTGSTWNYHVFLSFRGEDTRFKFTDQLHRALCRAGIYTFIDEEELRVGDEIKPYLIRAIEQSRISIIVFSKNYASSTWCLDELVKIIECKDDKKQVVLPIFYEVDPSEIRKQTGSYGVAMAIHHERYKDNIEKVQKWKFALTKAANLKGESYKQGMLESKFIDGIIQKISSILGHSLLHLPEQAVGLEARISQVISLLNIGSNDVSTVGICGIGGVGKTTIAKAVFNLVASQFDCTSFYANVRENTTEHQLALVQYDILTDMLGKCDIKFHNTHRGIQIMKERLHNKRVLLILDNVEEVSQLQSLAGGCDWFGPGSRVIITTRDKQLLNSFGIENMYEVLELNEDEALKLLCWKAFKSNRPKSGFDEVSSRILSYAGGIPLALEIIGSHLFGKELEVWESALDAYKKSMDDKIFGILKVSYESLDYTVREIFLDVACFFKGETYNRIEEILGSHPVSLKYALSILEDRCLVKIQNGDLWMHDLTQSMGREVVRRESEREPGDRSRICFHEDALQILTRDTGTSKVEGIMLKLPQEEEVQWSGKAFKKMKNLRILIIHNVIFSKAPKELPNSLRVLDWGHYPSSALPSNFQGSELIWLNLNNAPLTVQIHKQFKKFKSLTRLIIKHCDGLKEVPDISDLRNLTHVHIMDCKNLAAIHDSFGLLDKLKVVSFNNCSNLSKLPAFKSLNGLDVLGCRKLKTLPAIPKPLVQLISHQSRRLIRGLMDRSYSHWYHIYKGRVPSFFHYRSNTNSISFRIRKAIPNFHFGFAAIERIANHSHCFKIKVCIGLRQFTHKMRTIPHTSMRATTSIFWITPYIIRKINDDPNILESFGLEDWVPVEISVVPWSPPSFTNDTTHAIVVDCGIYVESIFDVQFCEGPAYAVAQNDACSSSDLRNKVMCLEVDPKAIHFALALLAGSISPHAVGFVMREWPWARAVWLLSPFSLNMVNMLEHEMEVHNTGKWILNMLNMLDNESLKLFVVIAWRIWDEWDRHCMRYNYNKTEDPTTLMQRIRKELED